MGTTAGITFQSGTPQKLTRPVYPESDINASISDRDGNLLFYTDGNKVYDRQHQVMPQGSDLKGTSYNICQIIPKPGDPNRYFIFTTMGTENWGAPFEMAYYSEVDLCLNNGRGDVVATTKNTPLQDMGIASIRSAAVQHSNGIDYWIAFHKFNSNAFYCYLITKEGINLKPVISQTGPYVSLTANSTGDGGEMKFSSDGKRLAMVISQAATAEVFDFNAQTGVLSNPLHIPPLYREGSYTPDYTHGIEFSPDGQKLYLTRTSYLLLLQYDLSQATQKAVLQSRTIVIGDTIIHSGLDYYTLHGMQLGPDGKLYIARGGDPFGISVVSKPNEKGLACLYQANLFEWKYDFDHPNVFGGFPTFVASYFNPVTTIQNSFDCFSATVQFSLRYAPSKSEQDIASIHWSFDDPTSGAANESAAVTPAHTFKDAGQHTIRATILWTDGTKQELKQLLPIPVDVVRERRYGLGKDTTLCAGATLRLDASHTGGDITWQDGSTKNYFDVTSPGIYWVRVCKPGCSITDSITVKMENIRGFLGKDTVLCDKKELVLDVQSFGEVIEWQDHSVSSRYTITQPGTYWVKVRKNNCVFTDSLEVRFCPEALSIPNIITPNGDHLNERFEITGVEKGAWSLTILNRYGADVYQTKSYQNDWNGAKLPTGTYYYYLRHNSQKITYKGWVELMR